MRRVPAGRPAQQHRDLVRDLPVQLGGEHLAEQRVVGVPAVLPVHHVDEAVLPAQPLQVRALPPCPVSASARSPDTSPVMLVRSRNIRVGGGCLPSTSSHR